MRQDDYWWKGNGKIARERIKIMGRRPIYDHRCYYIMSRNINLNLKQIVFARDGRRIDKDIRGEKLFLMPVDELGTIFQIDHIEPYSKTKDNNINNLCTANRQCNQEKSNKTRKPKYLSTLKF